jgi:acetate kinase
MLSSNQSSVLTINGGSSSIKFALYTAGEPLNLLSAGAVENIGAANTELKFKAGKGQQQTISLKAAGHPEVVTVLMDWLEKQEGFDRIKAIGHRVVHGMDHTEPEKITVALLKKLKAISAYDPEHLPEEIRLIELFGKRYPAVVQVACFDTAFHAAMPAVAKLLPIPRRFSKLGIRRYGFHGLSYQYLIEELETLAGKSAAKGKVIIAHLGSGASLAALKNGKSQDTSMGFTPTAGIPMSTRAGDLDPGVAAYLLQHEKLSANQ